MHYIIDGYNLLFRILTVGSDLAEKRGAFIENLNKKIQTVQIDVTIVFDSGYQIDASTKSHYKHLEIQFTSKGITADDWIIDCVKYSKNPEKELVVTSDKELGHKIRKEGGKTTSVEDFVASLNNRYHNKIQKKTVEDPEKSALLRPLKSIKKLKSPGSSQPIALDSSQEWFEFYLKAFEDNFNKLAISQKKPPKPTKHYQSDMERWLEAFEKDITDN